MAENGSNRDVTAEKKRKSPTRRPSSFSRTSKRPKIRGPKVLTPASASLTDTGSKIRTCSHCTDIGIGIRDKVFGHLINSHLVSIFDNMDNPNCISCELIGNAIPINAPLEITEKIRDEYLYCGRGNEIEIRRPEDYRKYGTLHIDTWYNECPIAIPDIIDFKLPLAWLERCKNVHKMGCGQRELSSRHSKLIDVILVDVIQNCVTMKSTASRYFALSYVWGGPIATKTTIQSLPAFQQPGSLKNNLVLPKTVSDAMILTQKMGARYLWVDCLSIIQNSPEKHKDIANMDVIFSQAELTIIAASAESSDSGLDGVQQGTRRRRATTKIQQRHILTLELPSDKHGLLHGTAYNSRGWTFQELLLSKRALFITEHQIVFHCDTSCCSESLSKEMMHHSGQLGFGTVDLRLKESLYSDEAILESYTAMVREYCAKRLSFQTDIKNAFAGLASILEEWCEGCPVIDGMLSSFFGHSMIWNFQEHQDYYSPYSMAEIGKRREGFPSWSWIGWVTCISNFNSLSMVELPLQSLVRNVEITAREGEESTSLIVIDKSVKEDNSAVIGQRIRINLEPANFDSDLASHDTLGFDAEQIDWEHFTVKCTNTLHPIFVFGLSGEASELGFLSITPDKDICNEAFNQAMQAGSETDCNWRIVRLYHFRMRPWDHVIDDLQGILRNIEYSGASETGFAENFRKRLQRSNLLYVLLIRRHGLYWERVGSGLMFRKDWPLNSKKKKVRAYHERIILV